MIVNQVKKCQDHHREIKGYQNIKGAIFKISQGKSGHLVSLFKGFRCTELKGY